MKKTENKVDETTLSDDELYAKIQTEKLLKKRKTKLAVTFAGLCVALAFAIVVIVLAAVPASLSPKFLQHDISIVNMYESSSTYASFDKDDERFATFQKYYSQSFSQPYLSAIFSGSLFSFDVVENGTEITGNNALTTIRGKVQSGNRILKLRFDNNDDKLSFVYQNGKDFVSEKYKRRSWDGTGLTFEEVYIEISQTAGLQDTQIFVVATYPNFVNGEQSGTINRLITVTVKANTNVLYQAWSEFGR